MKLTWFGNCCFLIETTYPQKIVFSPNEEYLNSDNINSPTLYISNSLSIDYNLPKEYLSKNKIINSPINYSNEKITLQGFITYKDRIEGLKRGENLIYILNIDNLKIVHLGLIGNIPDNSILDKIKNADILFIPVGGNICIDGNLASKLLKLITPNYIFPMSYKHSPSTFYFNSLHDFIITQDNVLKFTSSTIHVNDLLKLPTNTTIILQNYLK